jgi:hypothetical protein
MVQPDNAGPTRLWSASAPSVSPALPPPAGGHVAPGRSPHSGGQSPRCSGSAPLVDDAGAFVQPRPLHADPPAREAADHRDAPDQEVLIGCVRILKAECVPVGRRFARGLTANTRPAGPPDCAADVRTAALNRRRRIPIPVRARRAEAKTAGRFAAAITDARAALGVLRPSRQRGATTAYAATTPLSTIR